MDKKGIERPRILMVSEEGRGGGALKRMLLVASDIRDQAEVTICLPSGAKNFMSLCASQNVNYKAIPLHPLTKNTMGLIRYIVGFWSELRQLKKLVRELSPDVIHANGSWQIKAVIVARRLGVPCIWHMNDQYQPAMVRLLYKLLSPMADYRIYASQATQSYYQKYDQPRLSSLIPAPVPIAKAKSISTRKSRETNQPIDIISVAYINRNKGIHIMIDMMNVLVHTHVIKNCRLRIVGAVLKSKKRYMRVLRDMITNYSLEDHVLLEGYCDQPERLLQSADVYVCASAFESSPMALWEAMAAGVPVVSTKVGDLVQLNANKTICLLVERNAKAMADAIIELIRNPEFAADMASEAYDLVSQEFSLSRHSELYLGFCHIILQLKHRKKVG